VATLAVALFAGLWVIKYLSGSSFVFFAGLGLVLFHLFHAQASGAAPALVLFLLVAVLVLPMVAVYSPDLAVMVAQCLVLSATVSVVCTWISHVFVPEPRSATARPTQKRTLLPPRARLIEAFERWLVVYPIVLLFHLFDWSGAMITMIFVALLAIQPGFAQNFKAGMGLILGNVLGGVAAIVGFNLLTVVPTLGYLLLISLFCGLWFGRRLMQGGARAPLFGMGYSTMLLLLGSTTSNDGDAATAAYSRILQIMAAVVYVVAAFGLLRRFRGVRES
jgi:hypothetical protein